jgi:hypothetical protein
LRAERDPGHTSGDVDAAIAAQRRLQPAERLARYRQHPPYRHSERGCQREGERELTAKTGRREAETMR